jgi:hypothetical protein
MNAPLARRIVDYTLYVLIGLAVGVTVLWAASGGASRDTVFRWGVLGVVTILLFGTVIVDGRHLATRRLFWAVLLAFLIGHILVWAAVLRTVEGWKAIWWAPVFPVEIVAIYTALKMMGLDPLGPKRESTKKSTGRVYDH